MHNNLSADLLGGVIKLLGQGAVASAGDREFKLHALLGADDVSLHAVGTGMGQRPMYRNRNAGGSTTTTGYLKATRMNTICNVANGKCEQ